MRWEGIESRGLNGASIFVCGACSASSRVEGASYKGVVAEM